MLGMVRSQRHPNIRHSTMNPLPFQDRLGILTAHPFSGIWDRVTRPHVEHDGISVTPPHVEHGGMSCSDPITCDMVISLSNPTPAHNWRIWEV